MATSNSCRPWRRLPDDFAMTTVHVDNAAATHARKRLVLVGAGHAHAQVLLALVQQPIPGLDITLISPWTQAPYSGMVPAWLAGEYDWKACCIDFGSLCMRAGARLIAQNVVRIDAVARHALLESGMKLDYDWLSVNIGSTLHAPTAQAFSGDGPRIVPMRPLTVLRACWQEVLDDLIGLPVGGSYRVLMIGGGAAGIESILSAHHRLTTLAPGIDFQFTLATQGRALAPGLSSRASSILRTALRERGIMIRTGFSASRTDEAGAIASDGQSIPADAILWATGAQAFVWPRDSGLATDERGFIRIDSTLRSVSHPDVFATGDCASWEDALPKAGVYAVRMGPVLAHNLRAVIGGMSLQLYRPQRRYLVLVGTGGRHAVASWGPLGCHGAWVHAWKQKIDRRFLARYNVGDIVADTTTGHPLVSIEKKENP